MKVNLNKNILLEHYILNESEEASIFPIKDASTLKYIKSLHYNLISDSALGKSLGLRIVYNKNTYDFVCVSKKSFHKPEVFDKLDHIFILLNQTSKKVLGLVTYNTATVSELPDTRLYHKVVIKSKSEKEKVLVSGLLYNCISNLKKTGHITHIAFVSSVDPTFKEYVIKKEGYIESDNGNYIVDSPKLATGTKADNNVYTAAVDNEKNVSVGGTRDWEKKSLGLNRTRQDGMPGGNKSKDYTTKGDHGQAGLDMMFKAFDKVGDYVFDREASKKYRV